MKRLIGACAAIGIAATCPVPSQAEQNMTARAFQELNPDQRTYYIGGIVHMLMLHTAIVDDGDETRSRCVSRWYFDGPGPSHIKAAFTRFPDDDPASLVEAMMRLECGKGKEKDSPNLNRRRGD